MCVEWKDGSSSWERLADLKESYPIQIAEYAQSKGIAEEPAFAWWTPYVLRRWDRIIASVNKQYHKRTHKFGIEIPRTVERALQIDKENGNNLWRDAIAKEMKTSAEEYQNMLDCKDAAEVHELMNPAVCDV